MDKKATIQNDLLKDLGLSDLPREKQAELVVRMTEVLLKQIFLETMDRLKDEGKVIFEKMTRELASQEDIEKFLKEKISNYDAMLEKIIADFKEDMKKGIVV